MGPTLRTPGPGPKDGLVVTGLRRREERSYFPDREKRGEERRRRNTRVLILKYVGVRVLRVTGFLYYALLFPGKTFMLTHLFLRKTGEAHAPLSQKDR